MSFDITPRNYSKSQFEAEVKSKLETASPNTRTYTVAISSITGLLTITVSAGTFALLASTLLGFTKATSQAASQTSVSVINLTGPCCLQLRSSTLGSAMSHVSNIVNQSCIFLFWNVEFIYSRRVASDNICAFDDMREPLKTAIETKF